MQNTPCCGIVWCIRTQYSRYLGFSCGSAGKESACNAGDLGLIRGLGRSPGEGKGYPLQYSGLENSMDCIVSQSDVTEWLSLFQYVLILLWGFQASPSSHCVGLGLSAPFILHTPGGFCFSMYFGGHFIMEKYGECKGPSEGWFFTEYWAWVRQVREIHGKEKKGIKNISVGLCISWYHVWEAEFTLCCFHGWIVLLCAWTLTS